MKEIERVNKLYDSVLKEHLSGLYNEKYKKGWHISELVRKQNGDWLVYWEKDWSN